MTDLTPGEIAFLNDSLDLARAGRTQELAALLDAGLPADLTSAAGDTLLVLAAYHDHPGTVAMLLEHGADHARVNDRGQTALAAAVYRRSQRSVSALLAAGADPDLGERSAAMVADFFKLDDMRTLLSPGRRPRTGSGWAVG